MLCRANDLCVCFCLTCACACVCACVAKVLTLKAIYFVICKMAPVERRRRKVG